MASAGTSSRPCPQLPDSGTFALEVCGHAIRLSRVYPDQPLRRPQSHRPTIMVQRERDWRGEGPGWVLAVRAGFRGEVLELGLERRCSQGVKWGQAGLSQTPPPCKPLSCRDRWPSWIPGTRPANVQPSGHRAGCACLPPTGSAHAAGCSPKARTEVTKWQAGDKLKSPAGFSETHAGLGQHHGPLRRQAHPARGEPPLGNHGSRPRPMPGVGSVAQAGSPRKPNEDQAGESRSRRPAGCAEALGPPRAAWGPPSAGGKRETDPLAGHCSLALFSHGAARSDRGAPPGARGRVRGHQSCRGLPTEGARAPRALIHSLSGPLAACLPRPLPRLQDTHAQLGASHSLPPRAEPPPASARGAPHPCPGLILHAPPRPGRGRPHVVPLFAPFQRLPPATGIKSRPAPLPAGRQAHVSQAWRPRPPSRSPAGPASSPPPQAPCRGVST